MKNFNFPTKIDFNESHVYMLFPDGEINMTKSGNGLLGQRSVHMSKEAVVPYDVVKTLPKSVTDLFTEPYGNYKFVYLNHDEEADDYRAWLQAELLTDTLIEHMKEELLYRGWGIDKLLTKEAISRAHSSMIGFQHSIAGSLKTQRNDANHARGSSRVRNYVDGLLNQEDYILNIDWIHCDIARQMNWAWDSFDCTKFQHRLYRDSKYESIAELLIKAKSE